MALDIKLEPYVLESVLVRDSYLTHYQATGAGRTQFVATEFYPTYMADRTPGGALKISDRFVREFESELDSFKTRAEKISELKGAIFPIEGIIDRNNTAYVVRRVCGFVTIESYMNGQKMPFVEAFLFLRPLLITLAKAQTGGVVFNFSIKDLRVTPQRQLLLDATFAWDLNFHPSLIEIVKLFFKLITGSTYNKDRPNVRDYGVTIPARLDEIINEVLSGNEIMYGSLDDFHKKLKSVMDLEMGNAAAAGMSTSARMMGAASKVLFFFVILSMMGLLYGGIAAFRASSRWADPGRFADASIPPSSGFDFSRVALTHPRDAGDTIKGSIHFHDIFLFYRSDWGRPVMARRRIEERALQIPGVVSSEEETIFIDNVLPSFINTWVNEEREGFIFFADGLSGNRIYRATLGGTDRDLTRISENTALNLIIIGDTLYYSNYNNNYFLYRIDLNTLEERAVVAMPVYTTATDGERLFFLSGAEDGPNGVFSLHPDDPTQIRQLAAGAGIVLFYEDETLYFNTRDGYIRSITADGEPLETWTDINVHSATLDGGFLLFTEHGQLLPRTLNMRRNEREMLDATYRLSYIWARNGVLYGLDYVQNTLTHMLQLP
jgi:hypothetical protein